MLNALMYSGIAGGATLLGILAVLWQQNIATRYSHYVNSFAAGALITLALTHLIPESVELAESAFLVVLASFIAFYILEAAFVFHSGSAIHYGEGRRRPDTRAPIIFSGLFLHSLIDGFIIAVGFAVSLEFGLLASFGVILHELPEGVTSFVLLLRSMSRNVTLALSTAVALATPVGAAIAMGPLRDMSESGLGAMMAIAGGSFLYVSASDMIPETHEGNVVQNLLFFLGGVGLFYLLSVFFE